MRGFLEESGIFGEKMRDFWATGHIFGMEMRDFRAKWVTFR